VMSPMPARTMLADDVYELLRSVIMDSSIPPGARVNIEDVARQLGVSPTPVRESLARLESAGLVDKVPLRGYRTTHLLDRDELTELYELRLLIEPNAAAQAARRITAVDAAQLRQEISAGRRATEEPTASYQELSGHDERLHDLILEIAGNETIRQAYARTHCHLHTLRLAFAGTFGPHTVNEHDAVSEAILAHDAPGAEESMRQHIEATSLRVLGHFSTVTGVR